MMLKLLGKVGFLIFGFLSVIANVLLGQHQACQQANNMEKTSCKSFFGGAEPPWGGPPPECSGFACLLEVCPIPLVAGFNTIQWDDEYEAVRKVPSDGTTVGVVVDLQDVICVSTWDCSGCDPDPVQGFSTCALADPFGNQVDEYTIQYAVRNALNQQCTRGNPPPPPPLGGPVP
jgi:hypothetical protein